MGQNIGVPPSVAGWPAYYEFPFYDKDWINTENLTFRNKLAWLLSHPEQTDRLLMFDFISFVSSFPDTDNPILLITNMLNFLCAIPPGDIKIASIAEALNGNNSETKK